MALPRNLTATLAEHISATRYEDLPSAAIAATRRSIFDTLGVILAGSGPASTPSKLIPGLAAWGGKPEATVIGHPLRLPAPHAAFANGAMGHQFDFDDIHDAAVIHPTANTLPAALAVAESQPDCTGADLVRAVTLANDLICRIGLALPGSYLKYTFLRGPVIGIWGATTAACALLKLGPEATQWAFGHTLHQTGVTLECLDSGSDVRGLRDGFSARAAVTAAWMAAAGVRGDASALEGRYGLVNAFFAGECEPEAFIRDLGHRYEGANIALKPWPSAREGHAALRATLELQGEHAIAASEVESVHLRIGPAERKHCEPEKARRRPTSRSDALQSLPFAIAVALRHGTVPLGAYAGDALRDPAVLALVDRVTWELDPTRTGDWNTEGTNVTIRWRGGRVAARTARPGWGQPADPLPADIVRDKFRDCATMARRRIADGEIDELQCAVDALPQLTMREFARTIPV